jgi:biopolymer transport protein ExbD
MGFSLRRSRGQANVPTDSLSDIAFLLIIFFILTTSIRRLTGFTSELPAGEKSAAQQTEKTPTVAIHGTQIALDDKDISIEELKLRLAEMKLPAKASSERVILLDASEEVDYQRYFEVMSLVNAAGGVIGILSEEEEAK